MTEAAARSEFGCPRCGQHRLAIVNFPEQRAMGYAPYFEIIGMGEPTVLTPPAIGCLGCGAEWPTVDAFRSEVDPSAGVGEDREP